MNIVGSLLILILVIRLRVTPATAPTGNACFTLMFLDLSIFINDDLPTFGTPKKEV